MSHRTLVGLIVALMLLQGTSQSQAMCFRESLADHFI